VNQDGRVVQEGILVTLVEARGIRPAEPTAIATARTNGVK
jgi:hypothetical protein